MQVRNIFTLLSGCLMLLFFFACSEEEIVSDVQLDHEEICFGVSRNINSRKPDSRALPIDEKRVVPCDSQDPTFEVCVETQWRDTAGLLPQSRGIQFHADSTLSQFDVTAFYYEEGASVASTFFTETVTDGVNPSGKTYYWPRKGSMDFIAITPLGIARPMPMVSDYNAYAMAKFSHTIPDNVSEQKDIMVAVSKGLTKETGNPVPLTFKHLLSSVRFKVGQMQFIKINSLTLSGVYGGEVTFTYDKNTDAWTNSVPSTKKTYTPGMLDTSGLPEGAEIAGNVNNATLFMIPQTLPQGAKISVSYTELLTGHTDSGEADISGHQWEAGKDYAYTFNIGTTFDVIIPTPPDQDAHYIMLEMPYQLGALSGYVSSIKATARFLNDGSDTSTKSGISLKFKDDLTETQKWGFWTDKQYQETITINSDGESSSTYEEIGNICGESELAIGSKFSGTIVLFIEENNGSTHRNGELVLMATLKNGDDIVIGQGNFKQLCPCWNEAGIGVERIEGSQTTHPYGFAYNRVVEYSNPANNWTWLQALGRVLYSWGANGAITDDEGDFITIERKDTYILFFRASYIDKIILNYGALNEVKEKASDADGLINTRALYNFTGGNDLAQIETDLNNNLGWSRNVTENGDMPQDYAAFIALARNRMYELKTITKSSGQSDVITYKSILYKDANNNDIIEWYLPSSIEAQSLVETGMDSNAISPLNGEYWSSTAGSDTGALAHSYTFHYNVFGAISENEPRMNTLKVRAIRKKP